VRYDLAGIKTALSKDALAVSPTLTGLGERSHLLSKVINLDTHVTDIVNVIKWESLKDIYFVAHSRGFGHFDLMSALLPGKRVIRRRRAALGDKS
jgi:hypothetical protein